MSFGVFLLLAFVLITIASFIWKYRGLIYFVGIVFLIWLFFKYFFVALIIILGLVIAYFIRRGQENERSLLKLIRQNKLIKRTLTHGEKSKKENMVLIGIKQIEINKNLKLIKLKIIKQLN